MSYERCFVQRIWLHVTAARCILFNVVWEGDLPPHYAYTPVFPDSTSHRASPPPTPAATGGLGRARRCSRPLGPSIHPHLFSEYTSALFEHARGTVWRWSPGPENSMAPCRVLGWRAIAATRFMGQESRKEGGQQNARCMRCWRKRRRAALMTKQSVLRCVPAVHGVLAGHWRGFPGCGCRIGCLRAFPVPSLPSSLLAAGGFALCLLGVLGLSFFVFFGFLGASCLPLPVPQQSCAQHTDNVPSDRRPVADPCCLWAVCQDRPRPRLPTVEATIAGR